MLEKHQTSNIQLPTSNLQPQTILVTGGAGFIGSHLVDRLVELGFKVIVIDDLSTGKKELVNKKASFYKVDICSPKISKIFKKERPQTVFHLAAQVDIRKSLDNPDWDARINIMGSLNVLKNFLHFLPVEITDSKFIFFSTGGAIYGEADIIPTSETSPEKPIAPCVVAKLAVEKYLDYYREVYQVPSISLRYSNVYGPRQGISAEAGVISVFFKKMLAGEQPTIIGDGTQTRDFIYIDDAIDAAILALKKDKTGIFNIGTGIETSINSLFDKIKKLTRMDVTKIYAPEKRGEVSRVALDYSKAKRELGFEPKYNLDEGLEKTLKWYLEKTK